MDIFKKCERIDYIKEYQEQGLYPYFHALQSRQDVEVTMEGKRRIMLGSNNTYTLQNTLEKARATYDAGVYCNPVLPPACPEGQCLLRTSLMATHKAPLLDEAADILAEVMRANG